MIEDTDMPIYAARIRHTQVRLWERYNLKIKWDSLTKLGFFLRDVSLAPSSPQITNTTINGMRVRALQVYRDVGWGNRAFIIEFDGTQALLIFSTHTNTLVTALPQAALKNLIGNIQVNFQLGH